MGSCKGLRGMKRKRSLRNGLVLLKSGTWAEEGGQQELMQLCSCVEGKESVCHM